MPRLLAALAAAPALAQSFHPLPSTRPGASSSGSSVNGVTADGAGVVGSARSAEGFAEGFEAFYGPRRAG